MHTRPSNKSPGKKCHNLLFGACACQSEPSLPHDGCEAPTTLCTFVHPVVSGGGNTGWPDSLLHLTYSFIHGSSGCAIQQLQHVLRVLHRHHGLLPKPQHTLKILHPLAPHSPICFGQRIRDASYTGLMGSTAQPRVCTVHCWASGISHTPFYH